MVCTRFHSMILSTMLRQKNYVLSYSNKTNNEKQELDIPGRLDNIGELTYNTMLKKSDFKKIDKKILEKIEYSSNNQFLEFDKWLNL